EEEGLRVASCRYLDARASDIEVPMGLGSRHLAAASVSKVTRAIGIVVSESAIVRVFEGGVFSWGHHSRIVAAKSTCLLQRHARDWIKDSTRGFKETTCRLTLLS